QCERHRHAALGLHLARRLDRHTTFRHVRGPQHLEHGRGRDLDLNPRMSFRLFHKRLPSGSRSSTGPSESISLAGRILARSPTTTIVAFRGWIYRSPARCRSAIFSLVSASSRRRYSSAGSPCAIICATSCARNKEPCISCTSPWRSSACALESSWLATG